MRSKGLVVIGAASDSTKSKALEVVKKAEVDFAITDGASLPGAKLRGYPTYVLYDRNGEIVTSQSGAHMGDKDGLAPDLKAAIAKALAEPAAVFLIDLAAFQEKSVARLAKRATKGKGFGRLIVQIDAAAAGGPDGVREEAERLKAEIVAHGEEMFAEADDLRETAPHRYYDAMKNISKAFRGHEIGDRAKAVYQPLRRDKEAKREIAAARLYDDLQGSDEREKKAIYRKIRKKYADTRFGRRALEELEAEDEG